MSWLQNLEDKYTVKCRVCGVEVLDHNKAPRQKYAKGKCSSCGAVDGKLSIPSECHSDDRNVEVHFDAIPWFKQASDKDIVDLAACGWGGDCPSDEVAQWMAKKVSKIADMFTYLTFINGDPVKKNCQGFECHVEGNEAMNWLRINRKTVYEAICNRHRLDL